MSLKDKLKAQGGASAAPADLYATYGVLNNPYPSSSQTSNNPRHPLAVDEEAEARILSFLRDHRSQVVVVEGTQGVGKTNFLNHFEAEIQDALSEGDGYYLVRYLADPEASFEGTIRRLFQELGVDHLRKLAAQLRENRDLVDVARMQDMRAALRAISAEDSGDDKLKRMMEWLLGFRLLNSHRDALDVQFRLDTVESKTAALRDLVLVSSAADILKGIFLLLDELEKQGGVLGPTAVVRYLSAMRAIIDSLPNHLFMMLAVTPDAMRRYSAALPAFRSRLQNQITLAPLASLEEATALAAFYVDRAREEALKLRDGKPGTTPLVDTARVQEIWEQLHRLAERRGDSGVRQREFLHLLHVAAEGTIQAQQ
jgi:hypothetical protein